jgi:hypothetical protein
LGGHGGAGGAQAADLFAVMKRLGREDLPLRLDLMGAFLGSGQLFFAVRRIRIIKLPTLMRLLFDII